METSEPPALTLDGVRRTYEAETAPVRALRGVDLVVGRGEFVALMGPSGCGKSTLLHIAAGLDRPDEGSVQLAGREITALSESRLSKVRRKDVGLVFQFFHLLESMSVAENIVLAALVAGASPAGRRRPRARAARPAGPARQGTVSRRPACPAASGSGSRSPARWPTGRPCCSPTSRPVRWTATAPTRCSSCSAGCTRPARAS